MGDKCIDKRETLPRTFSEEKAISPKEIQKTTMSVCPKTFSMAEDLKADAVGQKTIEELEQVLRWFVQVSVA